jgi:ankyrin repeat protein
MSSRLIVLALMFLFPADQAVFLKAVQSRDLATVRTMLEADPSLANAQGTKGRSAVVAALFSLAKGEEGFHDAATNEVLQSILAYHPKFDLFDTAALGTSQQLEAMLKEDSSAISKQTSFGWTPLHLAAFAGNAENTELLLKHGAGLETRAKSKFRNTPLQVAMLTGEYNTAKILLDHGADPLARQAAGFTPVHEAALLGRQDLVQLLLDHGAELNSRSDSGMTPLAEAIRGKHEELAAWLKTKGAVIEPVADKE